MDSSQVMTVEHINKTIGKIEKHSEIISMSADQ